VWDRSTPRERSGESRPWHCSSRRREVDDGVLLQSALRLEQCGTPRNHATLSSSEIATWTWDVASNRVFADKNLARLFSISPNDAAGGPIQKYLHAVHPDDQPLVEAAIGEALQGESGRYELDYRIRSAEGAIRWLAARGQVERNAEGQPIRFPGIVIDITQRKETEAALKEAQDSLARQNRVLDQTVQCRTAELQKTIIELEAYSYSISHDMRSPLRAMHGYAEILLKDYASRLEPEAVHYLQRIHRGAARLDLLICDVLSYSRLSREEVHLATIDLEQLIAEVLQNYPNLHSSLIRVDVSPLPRVLGHDGLLTQIVSNLLANALKFTPAGVLPHIAISAERIGAEVRVWFKDNGIGIAPEHQQQIFKIFGRVYPEKQYEGTGIGLAIVRKAVERLGGSAGVQSELGNGSRFWINLRAAD
jgi:PAS domain S-box-containing protein